MLIKSEREKNIDNIHDLIKELLDYFGAIPNNPIYAKEKKSVSQMLMVMRTQTGMGMNIVLKIVSSQLNAAKNMKNMNQSERMIKISIWSDIFKIFIKYLPRENKNV